MADTGQRLKELTIHLAIVNLSWYTCVDYIILNQFLFKSWSTKHFSIVFQHLQD